MTDDDIDIIYGACGIAGLFAAVSAYLSAAESGNRQLRTGGRLPVPLLRRCGVYFAVAYTVATSAGRAARTAAAAAASALSLQHRRRGAAANINSALRAGAPRGESAGAAHQSHGLQ